MTNGLPPVAGIDSHREVDRDGGADGPIRLVVAAAVSQLPVVRAIATLIAARCDFTLDDVADTQLAVDEACTFLVVRAAPGAQLECVFTPSRGELHFSATVRTSSGHNGPRTNAGFGWHVLKTLTNSVQLGHEPVPDDRSVELTTISFMKARVGDPV